MSRFVALAAGAVVLVTPSVASATTDTGTTPAVVAFAGKPARYAVIAYERHQTVCAVGCEVFTVDLRKGRFKRLALHTVKSGNGDDALDRGALLAAYRKKLSKEWREKLADATVSLSSAQSVDVEAEQTSASLQVKKRTLVASIGVEKRVPSMAATSGSGAAPGEVCLQGSNKPLCDNCRPRTVSIDGEKIEHFACVPKTKRACGCDAEGAIYRFTVKLGRKKAVRGNSFLVEPHLLAQNMMGGGADTKLSLMSIRAFDTGGTLLVVGSAAHEPTQNGTYFPLVAVVPKS